MTSIDSRSPSTLSWITRIERSTHEAADRMTSTRKSDIVGGVIGALASLRAAQTPAYPRMGVKAPIPPVAARAESLHAQFDALFKALK
jgi:hypothetical protein